MAQSKVMVALRDMESAESLVTLACYLAQGMAGEVEALHVVEVPPATPIGANDEVLDRCFRQESRAVLEPRDAGDPISQEATLAEKPRRSESRWKRPGPCGRRLAAIVALLASAHLAWAQSNTRLLLSMGAGVPDHPGFVFGPFSNLAMNEAKDIIFLSTLRSARNEIPAVVRSTGVTFSVVAFQGLRAPVPKTTFDTFSAPSLNNTGAISFTVTLKDHEELPASAVIRMDNSGTKALVTAGDPVPGISDSKFQEFSAPLISSRGDVVFGARYEGSKAGTGLFLWSPRGVQALELPAGLKLLPKDLLEPVFFSRDEAVFVLRGTPAPTALEQFFRALAIRGLQESQPPVEPTDTLEILPAQPGEEPVQLVLVIMEGENVQTALLVGDPKQPVMARRPPSGVILKPFSRIQGQTTGAGEHVIFAAAGADNPGDLGLYCYCEGQVNRLTSPEDFLPITPSATGSPLLSLTSDGQHTVAFIAPNGRESNAAIYVTSVP